MRIPSKSIGVVGLFLLRSLPCRAFSIRTPGIVVRSPRLLMSSASEEDMKRWDAMYAGGGRTIEDIAEDDDDLLSLTSVSQVRVVTFDLDNTLWRTGPTISAANDALFEFLDSKGLAQPQRVEKVMGELYKKSKPTYCPIEGEDAESPVLLTKLRKDATRFLLEQFNGFSPEDAEPVVEEAFAVWTKTRHMVIPSHFATDLVDNLERIRAIKSFSGQPVLVGAITDGNSDPRDVPGLEHLFDFCVNAQEVGVSKPDERVYTTAMNMAASHPFVQDLFAPVDGATVSEDTIRGALGGWWVHVGDDFMKDIVAGKRLAMRTIWAQELAPPKKQLQVGEEDIAEERKDPLRMLEEMPRDIVDKSVITMSIGADDFLLTGIQEDFADEIVFSFEEVAATLLRWHQDGLDRAASTKTQEDLFEVFLPNDDPEPDTATTAPEPAFEPEPEPEAEPEKTPVSSSDTKFCLFCGATIPKVAKFCSSCGAKQEVS